MTSSSTTYLKPAAEIIKAATNLSCCCTGQTESLPVPTNKNEDKETLQIIVLHHTTGKFSEERIAPPDLAVTVDAVTAEVVEARSCTPQDFGVDQKPEFVIEGFDLDENLTGQQFLAMKERLLEISSEVWEMYDKGLTNLTVEQGDVLREYDELFRQISIAPLRPYYQSIGGDFFQWIESLVD